MDKWISIKDGLPYKGQKVRVKMILSGKEYIRVLWRMKHNGRWRNYDKDITHWQPISQTNT